MKRHTRGAITVEVCESTCVKCGRVYSRPETHKGVTAMMPLFPETPNGDVYQTAIYASMGCLLGCLPAHWFGKFLLLQLCKSERC